MKPQNNTQPEPKKQPIGSREGVERNEPGQPTRGAPPKGDPETERIAKQQGTTQRGFGDDAGTNLPPDGPPRTPQKQ
jgi:hypothetical protein